MAGVVTRLVYQQRHRQRVNVYLDGQYAFAVPDIVAARLAVGQHLSDDDIAGLQQINAESLALDRATRFLANRPRSQSELERYLTQQDYPSEIVQRVVEQLQLLGYIDDDAFVRWWIENRSAFGPRGGMALRHELRQKGIAAQRIDAALVDLDEAAQAWAAGEKKALTWQMLPQTEFLNKMNGFLQRRGFGPHLARSTAQELWAKYGQNASNFDNELDDFSLD